MIHSLHPVTSSISVTVITMGLFLFYASLCLYCLERLASILREAITETVLIDRCATLAVH
jgi:hypothetical protein